MGGAERTPPDDPADRAGPDREWLLDLARALHRSLEVEELLRIFSDHLRPVVPHDSVEFTDGRGKVAVRSGAGQPHTCRYDIVLVEHRLGTLELTRATPFEEPETAIIEVVASNLVYPLRNALLYREARNAAARDPLTGVHNRASLETILDREVGLSHRHATPLSLLMVDVDHFKRVNDTHGHVAGDSVLRAVTGAIRRCARDSDVVCRYGGEEFAVVLSNTREDGAMRLAERIRETLAETPVQVAGRELAVTVSIGAATLADDDARTTLLEKSDAALYRSKADGRNRVTMWRPSLDARAASGG